MSGCGCDSDCKMGELMKECMGKCECSGFMFLVLGIVFLLLGYFLSPETVRVIWLVFSGIGVLMGLLCMLMTCKSGNNKHCS